MFQYGPFRKVIIKIFLNIILDIHKNDKNDKYKNVKMTRTTRMTRRTRKI